MTAMAASWMVVDVSMMSDLERRDASNKPACCVRRHAAVPTDTHDRVMPSARDRTRKPLARVQPATHARPLTRYQAHCTTRTLQLRKL